MVFVANATPEIDAQSKYPAIIAICVVMPVIAVVLVLMRIQIRKSKHALMLDDWLAVVAMVMGVAYSVLCIVQTKYGLGLPPAIRPKANLNKYAEVNFAGRPIYQMGISFFKIALLVSYLRLLQDTSHKMYRLCVWIAIAFVFFSHLGCTLSLIFACTPVERSWRPLVKGTCIPDGPSFTAYAAITIVSDIIVALMPIPVLLKINIGTAKKLGLIGMFTLGLFTTVCSILRYSQIHRIQYGDHDSTMLVVWGVIEFNVGNMLSSLPFLTPVCIRKAKEYRNKRSAYGYGSNHTSRNGGLGSSHKDVSQSHELGYVANGTSPSLKLSPSIIGDSKKNQHTIMKSVTYSVSVEDEEALIGRRTPQSGFGVAR
ncbi:hypothetical protein VHEMI08442 [[Torrubiella] hemipterigena]|uniref:Rhodopsin domain-containing protein n=1 Tax=[Torrubiella] hemipterigena TaxID=1531966 RepID=A0A0A1TPQ2_9HYPO|nr:hypothetical protein VHEMI08442 [[Torrubiella] hemipterigena]